MLKVKETVAHDIAGFSVNALEMTSKPALSREDHSEFCRTFLVGDIMLMWQSPRGKRKVTH